MTQTWGPLRLYVVQCRINRISVLVQYQVPGKHFHKIFCPFLVPDASCQDGERWDDDDLWWQAIQFEPSANSKLDRVKGKSSNNNEHLSHLTYTRLHFYHLWGETTEKLQGRWCERRLSCWYCWFHRHMHSFLPLEYNSNTILSIRDPQSHNQFIPPVNGRGKVPLLSLLHYL